jgi:uncharacterized membrane-anchored protein
VRACLLVCLLGSSLLASAEGGPDVPQSRDEAEQLIGQLKPQAGRILLPGGMAVLNLPEQFRYLSQADTETVLNRLWGNPPGAETLGMIVPAQVSPLAPESWGVVITYDKDGHVKDDDAASIDYADLLKTMQKEMEESNPERVKQGYPAMTLVGWAEPPHYDQAQHKLYWAKELRSEGRSSSLNYNIRVLGREGVLVLNAVAGMEQFEQIRKEMKTVTAFTDFTEGHRYADFNASTDKVAEYGIAALIAGGAAAKLGFFGKLFALLLAFKKLLIAGVVVLAGVMIKLFRRKDEAPAQVAPGMSGDADKTDQADKTDKVD